MGMVFFFIPMGDKNTLMIATHLGMLIFMFMILFYSNFEIRKMKIYQKIITSDTKIYLENTMAFIVTIFLLLVKSIGFIVMAVANSDFRIAYGIGAIIFINVIFLLNQFTFRLLKEHQIPYKKNVIDIVSGILLYWVIYFLSFQFTSIQKSIFETDFIVILLLSLFVILSLGFYVLLYQKTMNQQKDQKPLLMSAIIFFTSLILLFMASPELSQDIYPIVFNLLLFVIIGLAIYYASKINSTILVNFSIVGFIILVYTRYFDIFWNLLSGSIFIMMTGFVLLLGGYLLDRMRRKLIHDIKEEDQS